MIESGIAGVADLLRQAREAFHDDAAALAVVDELQGRLEGPLRIAMAGMVKAGKSTLLNAIIGEEIAPPPTPGNALGSSRGTAMGTRQGSRSIRSSGGSH